MFEKEGEKEREREREREEETEPLRLRTKLRHGPLNDLACEEFFFSSTATSTYRDKDIVGISRYAMMV